jgi:hypothetical protein
MPLNNVLKGTFAHIDGVVTSSSGCLGSFFRSGLSSCG